MHMKNLKLRCVCACNMYKIQTCCINYIYKVKKFGC